MAEWLRRLPAKQLDYVLAGSNPAVVEFAVAQLVERQTVVGLFRFLSKLNLCYLLVTGSIPVVEKILFLYEVNKIVSEK